MDMMGFGGDMALVNAVVHLYNEFFRLVNETSSGFFQSSRVNPMGCVENVEALAAELGCKVESLPSYLGLPLGAPFKSMVAWDGVEERTVKWRLKQIQRDFLWGGGALERKPHLVRWALVCLDKRKGDLGGKVWEEQGGWCSKEVRGGYGVGLWKAIRREWDVVSCKLSFVVGNDTLKDAGVKDVWSFIEGGGNRVLWIETKCGKFSVKSLYKALDLTHRPLPIDCHLEFMCAAHGEGGVGARISLDPSTIGRIDEANSFLLGLNGKSVQWDVEDRVLWIETKCGKFSVKSLSTSPRI
ncbi:hypothetical protein CK203_039502 [Vitis vinifera]|uniref:Uncharacterized protein n=1 Tax=Vitis vinifera TaxID=29760 RepID=A0A438HKF7_VITVI|nr:hypothetical protein CK203_039502 [Vitis vinifera]